MLEKIKKIKLVVLDVDGVLTDASLNYSQDGMEIKKFNVRDGLGIKFLMKSGIEVAIITGRISQATAKRAKELGIKHVFQGFKKKRKTFEKLLEKLQLKREEACFIGDDLIDVPVLLQVGFACAVSDAVPEVKEVADYVSKVKGGLGAVREIIELILKTQNKWENILAEFFNNDEDA